MHLTWVLHLVEMDKEKIFIQKVSSLGNKFLTSKSTPTCVYLLSQIVVIVRPQWVF
jgi:hypothetical protein